MNRSLSIVLILAVLFSAGHPCWGAPQRKPAAAKLSPLSVLSIIPAQGEPGMSVTLNGTGFTDQTTAFFGRHRGP